MHFHFKINSFQAILYLGTIRVTVQKYFQLVPSYFKLKVYTMMITVCTCHFHKCIYIAVIDQMTIYTAIAIFKLVNT